MSIENPLQGRKKVVEIVLKTVGDPTPSATVTNALEITQDSAIVMDQTELNSQSEVASATMTKAPSIVGRKGGTATINGHLISTDGTNPPPIGKGLQLAGNDETESQILNFSSVSGLSIGDEIEGDTSGATGKVRVIDGTVVVVSLLTATLFQAEDVDTGTYTITSVESEVAYTYTPNSDSNQVGSVFLYEDGSRKALKDVAMNFQISVDNGGLPQFTLTGLGKKDSTNWGDAALPDVTFNGQLPPVFTDSDMLFTLPTDTYIPINLSAEFNYGATPVMRGNSVDSTGFVGAFVSSRSDAGGTLSIEKDKDSVIDIDAIKNNSTLINLTYRIGDGTIGRTWYINETIQITDWAESDVDGILTYDLTFERVSEQRDDDEGFLVAI